VQAKATLEMLGTRPVCTAIRLSSSRQTKRGLPIWMKRFGDSLAWRSIVDDVEALNLTPHQQWQAASQRDSAAGAVQARLPETHRWLLIPAHFLPQSEVEWHAFRLSGQEPLAIRASKKLKNGENIIV